MSQIAKDVQSAGRRMTAFGIITIIIGIASIAAPLVTGVSIVVSVGIFVIAAGILRMMWAFQRGQLWQRLAGVCDRRPDAALRALTGVRTHICVWFSDGPHCDLFVRGRSGRDRRSFPAGPRIGPDVDDYWRRRLDRSRDDDVAAVSSVGWLGDWSLPGHQTAVHWNCDPHRRAGVRTIAKGAQAFAHK